VASNASGQSGRFARSRWQPGPVDYDSARFDINLDVFFTVRVSIGAPPPPPNMAVFHQVDEPAFSTKCGCSSDAPRPVWSCPPLHRNLARTTVSLPCATSGAHRARSHNDTGERSDHGGGQCHGQHSDNLAAALRLSRCSDQLPSCRPRRAGSACSWVPAERSRRGLPYYGSAMVGRGVWHRWPLRWWHRSDPGAQASA
jgi:hypothetical protein